MLLGDPQRHFDSDGIGIRQGIQAAGATSRETDELNSLIIHLSSSVQLKCASASRHQVRRVVPGDIHILPEGVQVELEFSRPSEILLFSFDRQRLDTICHDLNGSSLRLGFYFSVRDTQISSLVQAMQEELRSGCVRGEMYMQQLAATVIRYVASTYSATMETASKPPDGLTPNRLRFILDHIHSNIPTRLQSRELAKLLQMSPQHFGNLFRKSTGRTPYDYILHERVEQGKRLLAETRLPIMEIALDTGFAHHSHFADVFRQLTGMTPKQYRQRYESFQTAGKGQYRQAS